MSYTSYVKSYEFMLEKGKISKDEFAQALRGLADRVAKEALESYTFVATEGNRVVGHTNSAPLSEVIEMMSCACAYMDVPGCEDACQSDVFIEELSTTGKALAVVHEDGKAYVSMAYLNK